MPHKFNAARRHKFDKAQYRVINWAEYNESLRQRGDLTIWVSEEAQSVWRAPRRTSRGGQRRYSDLAIETCLTLRANLTHDDVGDSTALPGLLDQLDAPVTGFLADGAYDGASTRDLLRERYGETLDVVIPPPKNAVIRPQSARGPTVRDRHIAQIRSNGRMAWQVATGYNQRSRIETQIGRWKSVIGPKLKSRSFSRQITEIQVGQKVLNTMTALGRPVFERIA